MLDAANPGSKIIVGIFRNQAIFQAYAFCGDFCLGIAKRLAKANPNLFRDQIHAFMAPHPGNAGRYAVFHLDPGIYFHQEWLALAGNNPFPGADIVIANLFGHGQGILDNICQDAVGVKGIFQRFRRETGRDLDAFLQPRGLDRAVSGAEMNRIQAAAVGYYLDFKMIEIRNSLLNQNALVLELPEGIIANPAVNRTELVRIVNFLNSHAATAGRGLYQNQGPFNALPFLKLENRLGNMLGFHFVINRPVRTRNSRNAKASGQAFCIDLVPKLANDFPRRPNEDH